MSALQHLASRQRMAGQPFAFHYGLPVDSAGALTDGRSFKDIRDFKKLLLDHEERTVARNLVSQLAIYATGAPIGVVPTGESSNTMQLRGSIPSRNSASRNFCPRLFKSIELIP